MTQPRTVRRAPLSPSAKAVLRLKEKRAVAAESPSRARVKRLKTKRLGRIERFRVRRGRSAALRYL